jgi:hypothetical protein
MPACHRCGTGFEASGVVSRSATCLSCNAFLKSCRNCDLHDAASKNECREPHAEPVPDKAASNFCEFFQANRRAGTTNAPKKPADDPFAALFKK